MRNISDATSLETTGGLGRRRNATHGGLVLLIYYGMPIRQCNVSENLQTHTVRQRNYSRTSLPRISQIVRSQIIFDMQISPLVFTVK